MKYRSLQIFLALAATASVFAAVWIIDRSEQARFHQKTRSHVLRRVSTARAYLEGALNRRLFLTRGLVAHVATNPKINDAQFQVLASVLLANQTGIRSLQLAKNSIVSHIYPLAGNEAAMGQDLLKNPAHRAAVQRSIETRRLAAGGPTELPGGPLALFGYTPIFLRLPAPAPGSGSYWGLAMIVIEPDSLITEAGLLDKSAGLRFSLRGKDGMGALGDVFFGDDAIFRSEPVISDVFFRNGSWQLAAIPLRGWPMLAPGSWKWRTGGGLLAILAGLLVWLLAREPERLRRAVERATTALRRSQQRYRTLAKLSPVGMFHADANGRCLYVNERWCEISGLTMDQALGDGWVRALHPEDREQIVAKWYQATKENTSFEAEFRLQHPSGKTRWVFGQSVPERAESGEVTGYVGAITDISQRKRAEEQARQHQAELAHVLRLSTMGEMASGLAHELNQPLAAIANYANGCAIRLQHNVVGNTDGLVKAMNQIAVLAVRAGEIIRRLRNFVRKEEPKREPAHLNDIVREATGFLETEAREHKIAVRLELAEPMPPVQVDPIQIEQVILNLVRNGFDAINAAESSKRELVIQTALVDPLLAQVSIQDTGKGVPSEIIEKVFNPFFTTKANGIGMGLSISRSIVEAHGGQLSATLNSGSGTTFQFTLPIDHGDH